MASSRSDPHFLFRRCVQCPPQPPSCPACASDETCSLNAQSCTACASTSCVQIGTLPGQLATKSSTPVGPIAGGVVGGVVAVAVAAFLLYWFYLRKRKPVETWNPPEKRDQSTLHRGERQSNARSAHSIASTVHTRASNVIQIAYIPGVTVRSPPDSPGLAIPPVPSIPAVVANNSAVSSPQVEQHFFMPGDLRDSTWSDGSSMMDPRISIAPSLARNSVATEMYRDSAIVPPIPAQHAQITRPNVVSVKSGSSTPSAASGSKVQTPSIPQVPRMGGANTSIVIQNAKARPVEVKKTGSAPKVPTLRNLAREASKKTKDQAESSQSGSPGYYDEKEVVFSPSTVIEDSPVSPVVKDRPSYASLVSGHSSVSAIMPATGPLGSGNSQPVHRHTGSAGLTAMIEDAINRAARDPAHTGLGHSASRPELKKNMSADSGPFSDSNELKENVI